MAFSIYLLFLLLASILFIIWFTAYKKINAFFALSLAATGVGLFSGLPLPEIVEALRLGFGHTMEKIGLLIILGTTLGVLLEQTGATLSMAGYILRSVKEKNAPLAIAITGFVIGLPIFCDSGFIILSGLNRSLVAKSNFRMPLMASVLAVSLYAVHCLVPPHPGITVAVATAGAETGRVMLAGIFLALPAAGVGYAWCMWRGKRIAHDSEDALHHIPEEDKLPPASLSFVPVLLPIFLIALKSMLFLFTAASAETSPLVSFISFTGEPVIALAIGIASLFPLIKKKHAAHLRSWLTEGVEKAGMILAIIAAGGMFGEMLAHTGLSKNVGSMLSGISPVIFFPFLIAAILKTAQGSTTVAVMTAASLIAPMMPLLQITGATHVALVVLSMGAGSMVVSHTNDAYFWVISRFSGIDTSTTLKVYSMATFLMGVTVQLIIWLAYSLT